MRRIAPPFRYVSVSNMPFASSGECTGYSIDRVDASASTSSAALRERANWFHTSQSGRYASTASIAMNVANASFSHRPFHQRIVTRSPNHMCASSCATVSATSSCSPCVDVAGSTSSAASRYVMQPRFSMAPCAKSGRAMWSTFASGYGMP